MGDLDHRAERLISRLDPSGWRRQIKPKPFVVEAIGSPASGKTSALTSIERFFRRNGFKTYKPEEGAEITRHIDRGDVLYNIRTTMHPFKELVDNVAVAYYDIIFLDRGLADVQMWFRWREGIGNISSAERGIFEAFFLHGKWMQWIDVMAFCYCSAEEAVRRDSKEQLTKKPGSTTTVEKVSAINEAMLATYEDFKERGFPVILIDTTNLSEENVRLKLMEFILERMEYYDPFK